MIQKKLFKNYDELLHFLQENQPEQFAVLRLSESEIELSYIAEMEEQPMLG